MNCTNPAATAPATTASSDWTQKLVEDWTSESHQLAERAAYPEKKKIKESFADQSWEHIKRQIALAASRLASVINAEFLDKINLTIEVEGKIHEVGPQFCINIKAGEKHKTTASRKTLVAIFEPQNVHIEYLE